MKMYDATYTVEIYTEEGKRWLEITPEDSLPTRFLLDKEDKYKQIIDFFGTILLTDQAMCNWVMCPEMTQKHSKDSGYFSTLA